MTIINGTDSSETLYGTSGSDTIAGFGGDDGIQGGGGDDIIYGDYPPGNFGSYAGSDHIWGEGGDDELYGQDHNDYLTGGAGDDLLDGGSDDGYAEIASGHSHFIGDTARYYDAKQGVVVSLLKQGASQNTHGAGFDILLNIESLEGSAFGDTLIGDNNDNSLVGGDGDDKLYGEDGNDHLLGGQGTDDIHGGKGRDKVYFDSFAPPASFAPAGIDGVTLDLGAGTASYAGGSATLSGIESVTGSAFNDSLTGSKRGDTLDGADGDDVVNGAGGNDDLNGGAGADDVSGGAGNDTLNGGDGDDTLDGGDGKDTAAFNSTTGQTGETVDLAAGTASGLNGSDTLTGIENVLGGAGNDSIFGDSGANVLNGGGGADHLDGRGGNDTIYGTNYMTGGAGFDTFVFPSTDSLGTEILDLSDTKDTIDLSAIDADTTIAGDQAFTLTTTFPGYDAHGVAWVWTDSQTTFLYLYIDGFGGNHDEGGIILDGHHMGFTNFLL